MYALSIKQPWAHAIMCMGKNVENRTWRPSDRFVDIDILVHASGLVDKASYDLVEEICGERPPQNLPTGAILGVVHIDSAEPRKKEIRSWVFGPVCFNLSDPRPWDEPIPCRGQLNFWQPKFEKFRTPQDYEAFLIMISAAKKAAELLPDPDSVDDDTVQTCLGLMSSRL